ncbi:hypothetical protein WMY93_002494 [Mugilogobius chulae]|uniref:Secreted peptide n=1 Tax=Mugilogobius chulae TaxID=88201 RepID=A0AAW0PTP6_9GOBI
MEVPACLLLLAVVVDGSRIWYCTASPSVYLAGRAVALLDVIAMATTERRRERGTTRGVCGEEDVNVYRASPRKYWRLLVVVVVVVVVSSSSSIVVVVVVV